MPRPRGVAEFTKTVAEFTKSSLAGQKLLQVSHDRRETLQALHRRHPPLGTEHHRLSPDSKDRGASATYGVKSPKGPLSP